MENTTPDKASRRTVLQGATAMAVAGSQTAHAATNPGTILITGSSRGIGLEFAKRYAEDGWTVIATARDPAKSEQLQALAKTHKNIRLEALDVTDVKAIDALAVKLKGTPIDVLLNNAGISGGADKQKVGSISSTEGSLTLISPRPDVNSIFYRASKSALNMAMINMAKALKDKGIIVTMQSPGLGQTDFVGSLRLPIMITAEQSMAMTMPIIAKLTMDDTGKYFRHTGDIAPW